MITTDELSSEQLIQISDEIIENLKISGVYDDLRVDLTKPIWDDEQINSEIQKRFLEQCRRFCGNVDLSLPRNTLRNQLTAKFEQHFDSANNLVKSHIEKILHLRNDDIKSIYNKHARPFICSKYLPKDESDPIDKIIEDQDAKQPIKIDDETVVMSEPKAELQPEFDYKVEPKSEPEIEPEPEQQAVDMDIDSDNEGSKDEEISAPPYSPVGADSPIDFPPEEEDEVMKTSPITDDDENEKPLLDDTSNLSNQIDDNNFNILSFSDVSTVGTDDLSEFDAAVNLSDDEANVIGNRSIHFNELQKQLENKESIEQLKSSTTPPTTSSTQVGQIVNTSLNRSTIDHDVSRANNDTSTTKDNDGKRMSRTRKLNPKYLSDEYF